MTKKRSVQVFFQTAFLGDLILSAPTLCEIKKTWPDEALVLVCREGIGSFLKDVGLVDDFIEIKKGDSKSYRNALQWFSKYEVKRVITPHESLRSAFFIWKLSTKIKIGYQHWWNFWAFTERVTKKRNLPEVLRQLSLLERHNPQLRENLNLYASESAWQSLYEVNELNFLSPPPDWAVVNLKNSVLRWGSEWGFRKDSFVCIFPGSTWETKKWTQSGFQDLAVGIESLGFQVILMGSASEWNLCEAVRNNSSSIVNLAGKTSIQESLGILARARAVIGNDSASAHLASLVSTPTLTLFGPTVLRQGFRPWGRISQVLEVKELKCRPCGQHGHQTCPIGTHECMTGLKVSRVRESFQNLLSFIS